jgi:hypothetical protein
VARILAFGLAHQHPDTRVDAGDILARALRYGETLAVQDASAQVTGKLTERDAHRDRHAGIDQAQRAEAAKRAAMHNPDAIRRRDIERAAAQHQAPTPTFYTAERRELLAQANERIADRFMRQYVRDADPHRRPDRGDDRRADIALQIDRRVVEDASRDELALAENPLLEVVDNIATAEEVIERAKEE